LLNQNSVLLLQEPAALRNAGQAIPCLHRFSVTLEKILHRQTLAEGRSQQPRRTIAEKGGPQAWAEFCLRYSKRITLFLAIPVAATRQSRGAPHLFDALG